jgi:autoinducer 2-degrading protein
MYQIASYFDVAPERHQDFIDAVLEDRRDSLASEPGTRRFELIKDSVNPDRFYLDEAYDDEAAFEVHKRGPYFERFFDVIGGFATGPASIFRGSRVEGPARSAHIIDAAMAEELTETEKHNFIGRVRMQRFREVVPTGVEVVAVFFEAGARTRPHVHPTDQVLHFISGTGFVAFPGEDDQHIGKGMVLVVPAGMLHMHGATSRGAVCHLAVRAAGQTDWEPDLPGEWNIWRD